MVYINIFGLFVFFIPRKKNHMQINVYASILKCVIIQNAPVRKSFISVYEVIQSTNRPMFICLRINFSRLTAIINSSSANILIASWRDNDICAKGGSRLRGVWRPPPSLIESTQKPERGLKNKILEIFFNPLNPYENTIIAKNAFFLCLIFFRAFKCILKRF